MFLSWGEGEGNLVPRALFPGFEGGAGNSALGTRLGGGGAGAALEGSLGTNVLLSPLNPEHV